MLKIAPPSTSVALGLAACTKRISSSNRKPESLNKYGRGRFAEPNVSEEFSLLDPANLPRPYLFKDSGFRFEEEIRFVHAASPSATDVLGGAIFNIAAQSIICDFDVSREIPEEERRSIQLLAKERLNAPAKPRSPNYEAAFPDEAIFPEWEPFSPEPDLPPGIFPDLD